jgi:hypothetical protein
MSLSLLSHSGMCRYLYLEVGLNFTMAAVGVALSSDNLGCLKLLLEGRPTKDGKPKAKKQLKGWNRLAVHMAARKGYAECIALAVAHGCPWCREVRGSNPEHTSLSSPNFLFFVVQFEPPSASLSIRIWPQLAVLM